MIIVLRHSSPKSVPSTRLIKGINVELSLLCDLSQFVLKPMLLE